MQDTLNAHGTLKAQEMLTGALRVRSGFVSRGHTATSELEQLTPPYLSNLLSEPFAKNTGGRLDATTSVAVGQRPQSD